VTHNGAARGDAASSPPLLWPFVDYVSIFVAISADSASASVQYAVLAGQSNYGILGTVISALSRSPGGGGGGAASACSRSNSLIISTCDNNATASQPHAKLSPTSSLTVDSAARHLSPPPIHTADIVAAAAVRFSTSLLGRHFYTVSSRQKIFNNSRHECFT